MGGISLEEKMKVILAFGRADILACVGPESDQESDKTRSIQEMIDKEMSAIDELTKVLPALIKTIKAKRNGDQGAKMVFEGGEYKYDKPKPVNIPNEPKPLGVVLQKNMEAVAEIYPKLQSIYKNPKKQKVFDGIVNGKLKKSTWPKWWTSWSYIKNTKIVVSFILINKKLLLKMSGFFKNQL